MHIFWIAGLLLALIDLPDFGTSLRRIAGSSEKIAGITPGEGAAELTPEAVTTDKQVDQASQVWPDRRVKGGQGERPAAFRKPQTAAVVKKELDHA